jgi:hypothetical protein
LPAQQQSRLKSWGEERENQAIGACTHQLRRHLGADRLRMSRGLR